MALLKQLMLEENNEVEMDANEDLSELLGKKEKDEDSKNDSIRSDESVDTGMERLMENVHVCSLEVHSKDGVSQDDDGQRDMKLSSTPSPVSTVSDVNIIEGDTKLSKVQEDSIEDNSTSDEELYLPTQYVAIATIEYAHLQSPIYL